MDRRNATFSTCFHTLRWVGPLLTLSIERGTNRRRPRLLKTLVARGYIEECGHEPTPGNPTLFGTTPAFLERLGLDSLDQLPSLGDFIPDASIVEALERGLHVRPEADGDGESEMIAAELQSGLEDS